MSVTLTFDLSGLGVRLRDLPDDVAPLLGEEWGRYEADVSGPALDLEVSEGAGAFAAGRVLDPRMDARFGSEGASFAADQGTVEVEAGGRGRIALAQGDVRHRLFGLVNLVLAALGWTLSRDRGLVLHAAGVVLDGRAFLLVGASGAGKSTWARAAAEAGALVLSDDLVVLETGERVEALGVPFRARPFPLPPCGRWPVALLLLPRHGATPALTAVSPLAARAAVAANLPYVEPEMRLAAAALLRLPARELTFAPDASFVPLLRDFDGTGP